MRIPGLRTRVLIVAAILAVAFGGLTARLAYLQIVRGAELTALAARQYSRAVILHAQRGPIVDRHGVSLATSIPGDSVFAHPRSVGDPAGATARLAPILDMPEAELHALLVSSRPFVWLRRRVSPTVAAQVKALRERGLDLLPEPMRLYPNRELAAHVIGFVGADEGLEGVEKVWDEQLAGAPGKAITDRDALGRGIERARTLNPPVVGQGLVLTLDTNIQYIAEREIDAAFHRTGAKAAMAVVMEPRTGDVLAVAIRPTFNPNGLVDPRMRETWRNRAVTDPFEPGSTFKVIMAAAALEEGVVTPESRVYGENGAITIAKTTIHDWKKYGWLTFTEVLQNSSNVGSIKVGLALGAERYYRYMTAFGFGATTGVGLSGESRGVLREPKRWSLLSLPTMSIGQEVSVTALQMVTAFSAIANGGTLMKPRLVRAIIDAEGREVRRFEPVAVRQVVSKETAQTLTRILVRVVHEGTGRHAAIAGYDVGGKTGTAQKRDHTKRYSRAPGVLSFVGYAPADAPRFAMLVMLDEPKNEKWGSEAAAPIFAAIGRDVLRYLDVPPRDAPSVQIDATTTSEPAEAARQERIRLATAAAKEEVDGVVRMPDVTGKTKRQVLAVLAPLRVELEMTGRGVVVDQEPAPGTPLDPLTTVRVTLAPPAVFAAAPARVRPPVVTPVRAPKPPDAENGDDASR